LFKDKVVLDVGCGTGILSMFAAKSGAKHVYAIDMSNIIESARTIVSDNDLADKITLIQGKAEEVELPVDKVDVIISEWMGYALFYESMLDSVLHMRDKYLASDGILLPDKSHVYVCTIEDQEYKDDKINWWDDVYGFDMSCIKKLATIEPIVDTVESSQINSSTCSILETDIATCTVSELEYEVPFSVIFSRDDYVHALVLWFDVEFTHSHKPTGFSTGPQYPYTHWKQTVFYLNSVLTVKKGERMEGTISCKKNPKNPRDQDFAIHFKFSGELSSCDETMNYLMR
jgi:SAM-dependent methyltransferase